MENQPKEMGAEEWLSLRVGTVPKTSLGWFRAGMYPFTPSFVH